MLRTGRGHFVLTFPFAPPAWGKGNLLPPNSRQPPPGSENRPGKGGGLRGRPRSRSPPPPLTWTRLSVLGGLFAGGRGREGRPGSSKWRRARSWPPPHPREIRREEERGRGRRKAFFSPPFSPCLSRSDPQYLEKVFEDVWEGGREFSTEKLNLPYSSGCIWDLSPLTAPQGTDMIFRTTLQLPKIPSSLPGCLPGCIALCRQKGESNLNPQQTNTPRGRQEKALSSSPPSLPQCESHGRRGSRGRGDVMLGWRKGHKCKR